jgi:hypothetical protein
MIVRGPGYQAQDERRAPPAISAVADVPDIFVQSAVSLKRVSLKSLNSSLAFLQR